MPKIARPYDYLKDYAQLVTGQNRIDEIADHQSQDDRRFFDNNHSRKHRVRLAHPAEIAQGENALNQGSDLRAGHVWYAAVRNVESGERLRLFFSAPPRASLSEAQAREVFELLAIIANTPLHEIEAGLRERVR